MQQLVIGEAIDQRLICNGKHYEHLLWRFELFCQCSLTSFST